MECAHAEKSDGVRTLLADLPPCHFHAKSVFQKKKRYQSYFSVIPEKLIWKKRKLSKFEKNIEHANHVIWHVHVITWCIILIHFFNMNIFNLLNLVLVYMNFSVSTCFGVCEGVQSPFCDWSVLAGNSRFSRLNGWPVESGCQATQQANRKQSKNQRSVNTTSTPWIVKFSFFDFTYEESVWLAAAILAQIYRTIITQN